MKGCQRSSPRKRQLPGLEVERLESRELLSTAPMVPLNDLGTGTYQGFMGGLYPNGTDTPPAATETFAQNLAKQIVPLNASGVADPAHGKIVMVSVGMSNAELEFSTFQNLADSDPTRNRQLVVINGAQGGKDADAWADPNSTTWGVVDQMLAPQGLTPAQVEVAWVKEAELHPNLEGAFPLHAQGLQSDLEAIARNLMIHFPHIKIAYLSTRTHPFTTSTLSANPEPFAYETGFAVKWAIQDQINGTGNLNYDPAKGKVVAPLLLWGPYIWGTPTPRSDGFVWLPSDVQTDLTHPSASGDLKVAHQLLAYFKTDPTTSSWFLTPAPTGSLSGLVVTASASAVSGTPGLKVQFMASATDPGRTITQYAWTYDDGDFSLQQNPTKSFLVAGTYHVHLTVSDNVGHTAPREITITISPPARSAPLQSAPTDSGTTSTGDQLLLSQKAAPTAAALPPSAGTGPSASHQPLPGGDSRGQIAAAVFASEEYAEDLLSSSAVHSQGDSADANAVDSLLNALQQDPLLKT